MLSARSARQYQVYTPDGVNSSTAINVSFVGTGRCYLPSFATPRPLRKTNSATSYSLRNSSNLLSSEDRKKPNLLTAVVHQEEIGEIVNRVSRPTFSTKRKAVRLHPNLGHVDMNYYAWNTMKQYIDCQRTIFNELGAIKPSYRKCCRRSAWL